MVYQQSRGFLFHFLWVGLSLCLVPQPDPTSRLRRRGELTVGSAVQELSMLGAILFAIDRFLCTYYLSNSDTLRAAIR